MSKNKEEVVDVKDIIGLVLLILFFACIAAYKEYQMSKYPEIVVKGVVYERDAHTRREINLIKYKYHYENKTYEGRDEVFNDRVFESIQIGDSIYISINQEYPRHNEFFKKIDY